MRPHFLHCLGPLCLSCGDWRGRTTGGIILGLPALTEGALEDPELQCQVPPLHVEVLEDVFDRHRTRKLKRAKSLSPPLLHPDPVCKTDLTLVVALAIVTYPNSVPLS